MNFYYLIYNVIKLINNNKIINKKGYGKANNEFNGAIG